MSKPHSASHHDEHHSPEPAEILAEVSPTIDGSPPCEPLPPVTPPAPGLMAALVEYGVMAAVVLCVFQGTLIFHYLFLRVEPPPKVIIKTVQAAPREFQKAEYTRRDGDALLRIGEYEPALRIYQSIGDPSRLPTDVVYRIGICQEGLGKWDEATDNYRYVANSIEPIDVGAAQLALARVAIRRRAFNRAREPLGKLILQSGAEEFKGTPFAMDALYLFGLIDVEAFEAVQLSPSSGLQYVHSALDWPPERAMEYLRKPTRDKEIDMKGEEETRRANPGDTLVSFQDPETVKPTENEPAPPSDAKPPATVPSDPTATDAPDEKSVNPFRRNNEPTEPVAQKADNEWTFKMDGILLPLVTITASGAAVPVKEIIDRTAEQRNIKVDWSTRAIELTRNRFVRLDVKDFPLVAVWAATVEPLGITWDYQQATLILVPVEQLEVPQIKKTRMAIGYDVLGSATRLAPKHDLNRMARLELGNVQFIKANYNAATTYYKEALDRTAHVTSLAAAYNLAVTQQQMGNREEAREALFKVADGDSSKRLGPHAFLALGRMYLDDINPDEALLPLKRAVQADLGSEFTELSVIHLAMAYVMINDYRSAGQLMQRHRGVLRGSEHHNMSAFLVCYARHRAAQDRTDKQAQESAGRELIRALVALGENKSWRGVPESLLIGRAFRELTMYDQMAWYYREDLKLAPPGHAAEEMEFCLAEFGVASGSREPARKQFTRIYTQGNTVYRGRSGMKLAEMLYQDKQFAECEKLCRELLTQTDFLDTDRALEVMGQSYENLGQYDNAALCFSGQIAKLFEHLARPGKPIPKTPDDEMGPATERQSPSSLRPTPKKGRPS